MAIKSQAKTATVVKWLDEPEEHDFLAAESYLNLIFDTKIAADYTQQFRKAPIVTFKAKDIFRASALSLLGVSNSHVRKNQKKILDNQPLSPLLLVRDKEHGKVIIADGYHRMCSVYGFNEDAVIPCKIV